MMRPDLDTDTVLEVQQFYEKESFNIFGKILNEAPSNHHKDTQSAKPQRCSPTLVLAADSRRKNSKTLVLKTQDHL